MGAEPDRRALEPGGAERDGGARPDSWVGGVEPFLMESSSQFRSAGPLALTSDAYTAEFNDVKALGRATGSTRTVEQTYIAKWWQSNPVMSWNAVARDLVTRNDFDAAESARLFAMTNLSGADTAINCWNDKYHFDFWRPFQAIRRAGEDAEGNPDTSPVLTWAPLISAPYPDHTSGHMCHDGVHVTVLRMFFTDMPEGATRSRAHLPSLIQQIQQNQEPARSIPSRRRSTRSSMPASGRACTSAPPTCRGVTSASTWPISWSTTTSSRSATIDLRVRL